MTNDERRGDHPELPGASPSPNAQEFFDGLEAGEIRVQECDECGTVRLPKRVVCPQCGSSDSHWRPTQARPTLHTYTVVHRAPTAEFEPLVPYGIGLVDLEPGCRVVSQLDWRPGPVDIGAEVKLDVRVVSGGYRLEAGRRG